TGAGYYADKMEALDAGVLLANYLEQSEELDADILSLKLPGGSLWLGGQVNDDALNELVGWGWNASDWHAVLDRIHVRAVDGITELSLSERAYAVAADSGNDAHVDVYVGTDAAEQITGTKGNDFILTGDGDDVVHTGAGNDFVLAGAGSDHLHDDLAAKDRDGQARNDDDLYIGDTVDKNLFEAFADWLGKLTGGWGDHDLLEYSVADPENPASLAPQCDKVTGLGVVALGDLQAVSITVLDQNTGLSGTDRLVEIERVLLSERADRIDVTADMLAAPIWIDMGLGPKGGGTVGKADYDTVSYAGAGKPIVTVNGTTQTGDGDNGPLTGVGYLQLISELAGAAIGLPVPATPVFSAFTANDGLRVTGAEHVVLTPNDDVLWYGPINQFVGAITGWPSGDAYPHFGQIEGGAGNDVMIVRDARYVFAGEALDPSDPDSPTAASDLRLEVDGGEGEDRVMIVGGDGGIAIGGAGRDFVFNWGYKGQLYGDTVDGKGGGQDVFWWSPGSFVMDAEQHDRLQMFGIPLTGGWGVQDGETDFVVDWLLPFVRYGYSSADQLIVSWGDPHGLAGDDLLSTAMVVNNFKFGTAKNEFMVSNLGTLGMTFRIYGQGDEISLWHSIWGFLMSQLQALQIFAKSLHWDASDDPLVLDLDGDGIETSQSDFGVQFDLDGDWFAQRTGWVGADDGLLARDVDGNGRIDDIHELFGAPGVSGFAMLATLDDNADGVIDAADAGFTTLRIWRDLDQDGLTDAGELKTLAETGIIGLNTGNAVVNLTVANGNTFVAEGSFNWADGRSGEMSELVFDSNPVETLYRGDNGVAGWASPIDSKGYGKLTQLATAASNDLALNAVLQGVAASMTVGDITLLRAQAQP
ncbi:MAG: hypothetical protein Q7V62_05910, partial [Actinomycetota bacterium]|nr:hypothetical protein [Actinomycetota bacterium]